MLVHFNEATPIDADARVAGEQAIRAGASPHRHDELVKGQRLFASPVLEAHLHLTVGNLRGRDQGAQADVQALSLERLQGVAGDAPVRHGQEVVERLQYDDVGTQAPPYAAEFQPDHAGADDAQTLRHFLKLQGTGGVNDQVLGQGCGRYCHRHRAGGQNDVLRRQR